MAGYVTIWAIPARSPQIHLLLCPPQISWFENPRYDQDNYVYVTVRNRGTQDLRDAVVLLYWTDPASALAFPMDWKPDGFFNGPTPAESSNRIVIPAVPPGGTVVLERGTCLGVR